MSTAGSLNASQPELIRQVAEKVVNGGRILLATDNDAGGYSLGSFIREFLAPATPHLKILEDRPLRRGDDWNDVFKSTSS